jgi:hypothetical protein
MLKMRIRPVYLLAFVFCGLYACHHPSPVAYDTQKLLGTYAGNMGKGIVSLTLNYINGDIVSGFDVHQGNRRNLNGHVTANGPALDFTLNEPGDNSKDGIFTFTLDTAKLRIKGSWKPQHPDKALAQQLQLRFIVSLDSPNSSSTYNGAWLLGGTDSVLVFSSDGTCLFRFYAHSEDPTSQLNTVRGSFLKTGNTFRIDWEKNPYTPARQMTLVLGLQPIEDSQGDSTMELKGSGWVLEEMPG